MDISGDIARRLHDLHSDHLDVRLPHIIEGMMELVDGLGGGVAGSAKLQDKAREVLGEIFVFQHELRKHTLFEEKMLGETSLEAALTERETEVLVALTSGLSNKEIAEKLNLSIHTVISHRKNIVKKTGIHSLPELTLYTLSRHLLSPKVGMPRGKKS